MMSIPTVQKWNENIKTLLDEIKKVSDENKADWTTIKYYSSLLNMGSKIYQCANLSTQVLAMTRNIEDIDPIILAKYYHNIEELALDITDIFYSFSLHVIKIAPSEGEREIKEVFVS